MYKNKILTKFINKILFLLYRKLFNKNIEIYKYIYKKNYKKIYKIIYKKNYKKIYKIIYKKNYKKICRKIYKKICRKIYKKNNIVLKNNLEINNNELKININNYICIIKKVINNIKLCIILSSIIDDSTGYLLEFNNYKNFYFKIINNSIIINNIIWYRNAENILYMDINGVIYFINNNTYLKLINNTTEIDNNKIFNTISYKYFENSKILKILLLLLNNLNELYKFMDDGKSISHINFLIKNIDITYIYIVVNKIIYIKDIWEFYNKPQDNALFINNCNILLDKFNNIYNICYEYK